MSSDDVRLWDNEVAAHHTEFFPFNSAHKLISGTERPSPPSFEFGDLVVPDLGKIPLFELAHFVRKDRPKPVIEHVSQIIAKYGDGLTRDDIISETLTQLFSVTKVLWPSIGDSVIGVVGNVPSPLLVNPIGIWSSVKQIHTQHTVGKNYGWILAIQELHRLSVQ